MTDEPYEDHPCGLCDSAGRCTFACEDAEFVPPPPRSPPKAEERADLVARLFAKAKYTDRSYSNPSLGELYREAAEALAQPVGAEEKPVAYRYRYYDPASGQPVWVSNRGGTWNGREPFETQALYAHPAPTPAPDRAGLVDKPCTCHPDDNPPVPCPKKYALSECRAAALQWPHREAVARVRELVTRLAEQQAIEDDWWKPELDAILALPASPAGSASGWREALLRLCNAADTVGVKYFDTDDMCEEVAEMQAATLAARALLSAAPAPGAG